MTVDEKRQSIITASQPMMGRNIYSQSLRTYALTPYKDGNYYSDCSSFVCACYKAAGYDVPWMNSYGLESSPLFQTIDKINGSHIYNASSILRVADLIIWNGHVELVKSIENNQVYLQGHGSGCPNTKLLLNAEKWNYPPIVIRRMFMDDTTVEEPDILYTVQVGCFSNKDNAEAYSKKISSLGFSIYVTFSDGFYRVQCGAFKNRTYAENMSVELTKAGFGNFIRIKK